VINAEVLAQAGETVVKFTVKEILHNRVRTLLHLETGPGLGCTEPAAIGLGAAAAASLINLAEIDTIEVTLDPNLFKNALRVIIPGTGGECGLGLAAALGAVAGDATLRLQVFSRVDAPALGRAQALLKANRVRVDLQEGHPGIYIQTVIVAGSHTAGSLITGRHDHLESLTLDGQRQDQHPLLCPGGGEDDKLDKLENWLNSLSLREMVHLLTDLDAEDLAYIQTGIDMNRRLVEYGLRHGPGLKVGRTQQRLVRQGLLQPDMALTAGMLTAAGIDSRMGGVSLPAMTLAGSGNHGIAAGIPIVAAADYAELLPDRGLMQAVTLSYLITCAVKALTGRLSALCGCAVASGAGVAAGVAYLLGGTLAEIGGALLNHLECTAMLICDGAKTGCALKVGAAVASAVNSALLSLQGTTVRPTDGFIGRTVEDTLRHLGALSRQGLAAMDPVILDIMRRQCR
jgi:L-cysteine desulfidase